jgi:hypothetical protein
MTASAERSRVFRFDVSSVPESCAGTACASVCRCSLFRCSCSCSKTLYRPRIEPTWTLQSHLDHQSPWRFWVSCSAFGTAAADQIH